MTADETFYRPTESLILPSPRYFFPIKIPVPHWQLRHFISSPNRGLIYYVSEREIYCLHAKTRERQIVGVLPFEPRCLVAGYGWVCVGGGDNGQFAAVKLDRATETEDAAARRHADVDALLPADLDPESRRQTHELLEETMAIARELPRRKPEVRIEEHGGLIVNSVTLHQWKSNEEFGAEETVAIITNNDKTVRIFSLTQFRILSTLELPFATNHATLSPDGQLLVVVGDSTTVYFYRRKKVSNSSNPKRHDAESAVEKLEWEVCAAPQLRIATEHCFTTAFSPGGHLCAVGSQDGIVTIFDSTLIDGAEGDDDAVTQILRSSRPTRAGAVRSMCFSPEPWDLLIWAEDHGRICVADVRTGLHARQVIHLDIDSDNFETVEITDVEESLLDPELRELSSEAEFIRRYRRALDDHDETAAINFAADYIGASPVRRRLQAAPHASDDEPRAFTERERQLLDALRASRERLDAREHGQMSPFSVNYLPSPASRENRSGSSLLTPEPLSRTQTISPTQGRLRGSPSTTSDPWRTIEAAMAAGPLPDAATRLRREREASIEATFERRQITWARLDAARRERLRNVHARGGPVDEDGLGRYELGLLRRAVSHRENAADGVGTAGVTMDDDGRKLYVGTEEGITEFYVNIQERKFFPKFLPC
ncbi:hypothetical protein L228DRAFT_244287 [Xylona heveae TC161]|uniref:DUF2415 domain-containing protein n=1 Tax=Xylona heveae (strain CBS 132557 / TC161) TaxID=1328760 RepID=A0A165IVP5_XYLHT|nr:hypothetical protein L228DRAFT_244287 [Xylona heveae TC161]KZF25446.1 hypothetical protein L228DRAFT_244287 [Xylona heveae TC161]